MKTINIVCHDNGSGLSRDRNIVKEVLESAGYEVFLTNNKVKEAHNRRFDINIFIEVLDRRYFSQGRKNIFIPNPEWYFPEWKYMLRRMNLILAKTKDCEMLFKAQKMARVVHTSFTSYDRKLEVEKKKEFFHSAGRSTSKGTKVVKDAWTKELPKLNIIHGARLGEAKMNMKNVRHVVGRMEDEEFMKWQNESQFHICPSKYEGFGHYINEAKSMGAIVLTSDLAPMNEMVTSKTGILMKPAGYSMMRLARTSLMGVPGIRAGVIKAMKMSKGEIEQKSGLARNEFLANDKLFKSRFLNAIASL